MLFSDEISFIRLVAAALMDRYLGQVSHTTSLLSPSSIIWWQKQWGAAWFGTGKNLEGKLWYAINLSYVHGLAALAKTSRWRLLNWAVSLNLSQT